MMMVLGERRIQAGVQPRNIHETPSVLKERVMTETTYGCSGE